MERPAGASSVSARSIDMRKLFTVRQRSPPGRTTMTNPATPPCQSERSERSQNVVGNHGLRLFTALRMTTTDLPVRSTNPELALLYLQELVLVQVQLARHPLCQSKAATCRAD